MKPGPSSQTRFRIRIALTTLMLGLGVIWGSNQLLGEQALAITPVFERTVASIAQQIRESRGHVLILSLYRADSEDPYVVGDLRRWTLQTGSPRVELLAVATGTRRDAQFLFRNAVDEGVQRLPPEWLRSGEKIALDSSLAQFGVHRAQDQSPLPVTVIFDANGGIVAQWHGKLEYLPVLLSAKAARSH